jgi:hypothetical protein
MPPDVSPNPADPRFQRSYDSLVRAVTELLDEAPLSMLSIAQLVQRAGQIIRKAKGLTMIDPGETW